MARNKLFLVILILGLAVRLLLIWLPGTEDMRTNQIWGAWAAERGITRVYVFQDADYLYKLRLYLRGIPVPPSRVAVQTQLGTLDHVPDYPPLSLYLFWILTAIAKALMGGLFTAGGFLNVLFNFPPVLCSLGIVLLAWRLAREQGLADSTAWVAAFWLNPALILHTPVLGYVDATFALLALGSLLLAFQKRFTSSVVFMALACATKPQGVLIIPVVACAIAAERNTRLAWRQCLTFALAALLPSLPFVIAGRFLAALRGMMQVGHVGYLSSQHLNLWWIVGWIYESFTQPGSKGFGTLAEMLPVSEFPHWLFLDTRALPLLLWFGFMALNLRMLWQELRRGDRMAIFWASALQVYGFTMLSLYPKENHLYAFFVYALPLLFLGHRKLAALFAALSVVFGLNIFLFDGFGRGMKSTADLLRTGLGLDATVLVAFLNVGVFVWLIVQKRWLFDELRMAVPKGPLP